jgi:hypothetical protein
MYPEIRGNAEANIKSPTTRPQAGATSFTL